MIPLTWGGAPFDSKEELILHLGKIKDAGLPHIYNQPLWCRCCTDNNRRRVDWTFPCTDGHHAVVWEHSSLLQDKINYLDHFLTARLGWYERHADRYLLIVTDKVDEALADCAVRNVRSLMEDGGASLHRRLEDGTSRELVAFYRQLFTPRLEMLKDRLLTPLLPRAA